MFEVRDIRRATPMSTALDYLITHSWLSTTLLVRGPQSQVVTQELHDQSRILVGILRDTVKLGNGIFESCASHLASFLRVAKHFVLEHRVVQGQTQANRMGHGQTRTGNSGSLLISLACILCSLLLFIISLEFSNVTVVICLHLVVEDFGFIRRCFSQKVAVQESQNGTADSVELRLNLSAILASKLGVVLVALGLFFLLNAGDDSPGSTTTSDCVLVGHRQKVALLDGQFLTGTANLLHEISHFIVALGLLSELGEIH